MKKKELMKFMAVMLSASMIAGSGVPVTAADFSADEIAVEAETEETQEETDEAQTEVSSDEDGADASGLDFSDESDSEEAVPSVGEDQDVKEVTEVYLKDKYVDGKITSINGINRSEDGLTYTAELTNSNGYGVNSIRFITEASDSSYKSGWYFDSEWLSKATPSAPGRVSITRPTAEQGDQKVKVTLRLFNAATTSTDVINDEAQAAEAALATQEFTLIIKAEEPAEPTYTMSVKVQDEEGNDIPDADVTLEKNWSTVTPEKDGSYIMEKGGTYTLTVKKAGYNDYKESYFTFNPTETNTVKNVTLKKQVTRNIKFNITDKVSGKTVENPTISVKKGYYDTVKPEADGSYNLVDGTSYNYTVEAANYKSASGSFTAGSDETINVELTKDISKYAVSIKPVEADGTTAVEGAVVTVTYEDEDDWGDPETVTLTPNADGSYTMDKNTTYSYTVKAKGYKEATGTYKPSGTEENIEVPVTMQKNAAEIAECKATIQAVDSEDTTTVIKNATVKVEYEAYSDLYQNPYTAELKANEDGTYTMKKGVEYTISITADGYKDGMITYTPDGTSAKTTISVHLTKKPVDTKDQQTVDAIKALFDKEGAMRPNFAKDKNILDVVKAKINTYTDVDTTGVTITVKSSENEDIISADGTIHYNKADTLNSYGMNFSNVGVVYIIEKNGAKAETKSSTATVGWDRDHYNTKIEAEKDSLTWDNIKGSNTDQTEVTSDLTLPQIMTSSARTAWSKITWTSSDTDVISIDKTGYDSITDPKKGTVHAQPEDKEVTLTATFQVNDNSINTNVESVSEFATYTKEFKVTVKGTGTVKPTEEQLKALLDKYYTEDKITEFGSADKVADLKNCKTDLQLPRFTRFEDENGNSVFERSEIKVTADSNVISINGYKASVDRFSSNEDVTVNLVITFTREGVTAVKNIPVTIKPITEADVQDELNMMEAAKAHYFDGINDGQYADKDSVTGNLHPFQEMILDENGNPKWIYNYDNRTGEGIIPDSMFDDPWEMEGAGYNKFKSSNNAVVAHENLVVTRRENDTQITISSILSSERYGEYAKKYPDNKVLQKLYKQPVSVTVTIKGTKTAADSLAEMITEAKALNDSITEGTEAGQYKEGTKATLEAAIAKAEEVNNKENKTEAEASAAVIELEAAMKAARDAENTAVANVTVHVNKTANQPGDTTTVKVTAKDAAAFGYNKPEATKNKVTVVDALYKVHSELYGEEFAQDPGKYLQVGSTGIISTVFGIQTSGLMYYVNNKYVSDYSNAAVLEDGDEMTLFLMGDTTSWSDKYLYFQDVPKSVTAGEEFKVSVASTDWSMAVTKEENCTVTLRDTETGEATDAITDKDGVAVLKTEKAGKYQIYVSASPYAYFVVPSAEIEVKEAQKPDPKPTDTPKPAAKVQVMMAQATTTKTSATVSWTKAANATSYRIYGTKCGGNYKLLKKVSANTTKWTQKGLKKGTAYKYYVVAYGKNGKTAKSDTLHVNTTGGKYGAVKAITVNKKTVSLKAGKKVTLKATVTNNGKKLTNHVSKVRYASSNTAVATVNAKGVITAKKKGTCYVYCYAESGKSCKVKVTVK